MNEGAAEFINVVFDPNFQSFDSELAGMTLDKMMSIQYSEEVLQKNFSVMISILKQLHRGQSDLVIGQKDNKDWIQKLREITTSNAFQERYDSLDQKLDSNFNFLKQEIDNLKNKVSEQETIIGDITAKFITKFDETEGVKLVNEINYLKEKINFNQAQQSQTGLHDNKDQQTFGQDPQIINMLKELQDRVETLEKNIQVEIKQELNNGQSDQIIKDLDEGVQTNNLQDEINNLLNEINILKIKMDKLQANDPQNQIDGIILNLQSHDEKIKMMDESLNSNIQGVDNLNKALVAIRDQLKMIQSQIDQLQMTVNLNGVGQNNEDQVETNSEEAGLRQNQMSLILGEINKLRIHMDTYVTTQDFDSQIIKINLKFKSLNEHINSELETIHRENNAKMILKFDVSEAVKLVNEVNHLKEQINLMQVQKSQAGFHNNNELQNVVQDPQINNKMKDLQEQVNNLENELKNHRLAYNQYANVNNSKIAEIEKKIAGFQLERLLSELQQIREITDSLKKESDSNTKKLKELRKIVENFVSKEEMHGYVDEKIHILREEIMSLIKVLEDKINKKVDTKDLAKVEQNMLSKLEEVVQALIKQLANKQETKKALIYLEQKINQIFVILEGDGGQKDGDGLFTKKPLLWSCASCDKDLDKFKGNLGDYRGWAVFPPKETSPERMGRFGVGYKNMQEKVKVNRDKLEKERDLYDQQSTNGQRPGTQTQGGFYNSQVHFGSSINAGEHLPKIAQQNQK